MEVLDKENREISLNNGERSKSPYTIESLLLLDNSLLCNIEPDNGSHVPSEMCEPFRECNDTVAQASKTQNVATDTTASSKVHPNMNEWQDKTLMNQIFAQFDSQNEEEIVPENCDNISNFDMFDLTFCKENTNSELGNIGQRVEEASLSQLHRSISHQNELMNVSCLCITKFGDDTLEDSSFKKNDNGEISPILKTKPRILNECKISKKKSRLNYAPSVSKKAENETDSTNCSLFYGLPDTVKKLIQEVKGICELYRKFAIINEAGNKGDFYCFFLTHTEWQDECLKLAIRTKKNLIYALPTSGGKTLVAEILMFREIICNKKNAIFILPYVALVQEKV